MSDTLEQVQDTEVNVEQADISTQLQAAIWDDKPIDTQQQSTEQKVEEKKEEPKVETPIVNEWWKEFEFQDADTAKNEIKKLKETKPQEEIRFANDDSKKFFDYLKEGKEDELYAHLAKKKTVEKFVSAEVNESNAADIVKFSLRNKNSEYSEADIERKFNRQFGIPKEPVYNEAKETEEDFNERHSEWEEKVKDIKADLILEAKEAKADLSKLKTELVLPDISTQNSQTQKQPTQEELQAIKKVQEDWVKAASGVATEFKGFSTTATYKEDGKEFQIPVSYGLSNDEIKTLNTKLNDFASNNFDPYTILKERWINADGNDNINQVVKDLSWLLFGESAAQKFANEAAHQRMENYFKDKKNIRVDTGGGKDFGTDDQNKTTSEKLQEQFWGN